MQTIISHHAEPRDAPKLNKRPQTQGMSTQQASLLHNTIGSATPSYNLSAGPQQLQIMLPQA